MAGLQERDGSVIYSSKKKVYANISLLIKGKGGEKVSAPLVEMSEGIISPKPVISVLIRSKGRKKPTGLALKPAIRRI